MIWWTEHSCSKNCKYFHFFSANPGKNCVGKNYVGKNCVGKNCVGKNCVGKADVSFPPRRFSDNGYPYPFVFTKADGICNNYDPIEGFVERKDWR